LAEFPLCSLARFWTFDPFFRLAMIAPFDARQRYNPLSRAKHQTAGYQQIAVERATAAQRPGTALPSTTPYNGKKRRLAVQTVASLSVSKL